jgi:hypothetical protein
MAWIVAAKKTQDALVGFEQKNRRECVNRETEELRQMANYYCDRDNRSCSRSAFRNTLANL